MFGQTAPSIADIAAVTEGNNRSGWGNGDGWWVLIILFALFGWGRGGAWGGGFGGGGDNSCYAPATCSDLQRGFDNQAVTNKLNGLENGICSLGYDQLAQMNTINQTVTSTGYQIQNAIQQDTIAGMQQANALQSQLADCCCENRAAIAQVRYDMATNACSITNAISNAARDITDNQNANYRAIHDELVASQMEAKNERIAELQSQVQALNLAASQQNQNNYLINQLRPCPTPAYITCNPWGANGYGGYSYGSCCSTNQGCCC